MGAPACANYTNAVRCRGTYATLQVRLFASARVIVASHGAVLSNLLFAHPETRVLEVMLGLEKHVTTADMMVNP